MIKKIFNLFKASDFNNDPYGWLTNQIGHVAFSFTLCYLTGMWLPFFIFWILWEIRHLIQSKNIKDFIEDLIFELGGIAIFLWGKLSLYIIIIVLLLLLIKRLKTKKDGI